MKLKYLQPKGGAYYFVKTQPDGSRPWIALGSDLKVALQKYEKLVNKKPAAAGTVAQLLEDYYASLAGRVKDSSIITYGYYKQNLIKVLGNWDADELPPQEVAQYIAKSQRRAAVDEVRFLSSAYAYAILINARIRFNPAAGLKAGKIRKLPKKVKRYVTDAELSLVLSKARNPLLNIAIEIAYATALRVSDVLKLRWHDFGDQAAIVQQKTGETAPRQRYPLTAEIETLLDRARAAQRVKSIFIISGRGGQPIKYKTFWQWWDVARDEAGLEGVVFHDIRRKAGTDRYNQTGGDIVAVQKLLGHATPDTSREYLAGVQINTVQPMKRRKA